MNKLDKLMSRIQLDYVSDEPKVKQLIKDLFLEVIEDAYTERSKVAQRVDTYEAGTRLLKRILKQKVNDL